MPVTAVRERGGAAAHPPLLHGGGCLVAVCCVLMRAACLRAVAVYQLPRVPPRYPGAHAAGHVCRGQEARQGGPREARRRRKVAEVACKHAVAHAPELTALPRSARFAGKREMPSHVGVEIGVQRVMSGRMLGYFRADDPCRLC